MNIKNSVKFIKFSAMLFIYYHCDSNENNSNQSEVYLDFRPTEKNNSPKIARDIRLSSRRLNTVHIGIFTVFSNKEDGKRDKQDGEIIFFRRPYPPINNAQRPFGRLA
jgi:hypothetical protein